MATTIKNVSTSQLRSLRNEASQAGDIVQAAIADLAITGTFDADLWSALSPKESRKVRDMTQNEALAECVSALNYDRT